MNVENINKLIEHLKVVPDKAFDMNTRFTDENHIFVWDYDQRLKKIEDENWCGTSGCIAGHAFVLSIADVPEEERKLGLQQSVTGYAAKWLGMEWSDDSDLDWDVYVDELFTPDSEVVCYEAVTPQEAIKTLEILRDTGGVDWSHIDAEAHAAKRKKCRKNHVYVTRG